MKNYKNFGVMLDVSRNAVMNIEVLKTFINHISAMGYDTLELYAEDTYKINCEPYFGYQRGGYTGAELKEIDAYCKTRGVELIPCIQTLAHFTNLVRLPHYADIIDTNDILLIDHPKTYELIEKIFANCAENFTSRKINIGMDEAHMVGLGKYLDEHGYVNRFDLINKHLKRVCEIAKKYGFTPHMWSDMFFRLAQKGEYYSSDAAQEADLDQSVIDAIPEGLELAYWDYYHTDLESYNTMLSQHKKMKKELWFAGGAWVWNGFAPKNYFSLRTMRPAMEAIIKNGIDKVLITMWGDDGKECSSFSALPSLYAISEYAKGNFDGAAIEKGFEDMFGIPFDDFMMLDLPNYSKKVVEEQVVQNTSKALLYQDCFMGIFDDLNEQQGKPDYATFAERLFAAGKKAPAFEYLFDCLGKLCLVLECKAMLGVETRRLYKMGDKEELLNLTETYRQTAVLIKQFYDAFQALWYKENKPFGWEIHDARLGGLMCRVESCRMRLERYAKGEIDSIPELEEDILSFCGEGYNMDIYTKLISRSAPCWTAYGA